jgi:D-aspartate ligase
MTEAPGALVIGANLNGLTIARSLGRRGVPVWVATPPEIRLASFSRYVHRTVDWPGADDGSRVDYLLRLGARHNVRKWALFPTCDESAALLAKFHAPLSSQFLVSTPTWDALRWAYDKRLTYRLAAEQQVDYPATFYPATEADVADFSSFPAILKPATHAVVSRFTADKAWAVDNREELLGRYREARNLMPPEQILLQERVPGGGEAQFSFAALCREGRLIASLTARRTRQYPVDFGYSSSFVETLDVPEIVAPSLRLLSAMRYTGIVELEYKFDHRDGRYKLLDINPRLWTWAALGYRAGVDFPYLLWRLITGKGVAEQTGRNGVHWLRMSTDVPAALHQILRGKLPLSDYLRSLRGPVQFALIAADDPMPGLLDLPLYAYKHARKFWNVLRNPEPLKLQRVPQIGTK